MTKPEEATLLPAALRLSEVVRHHGTWYGWNLSCWLTRHFASAVGRNRHKKHGRKLRHPRIRASWGGLWKPLRVGAPWRKRWKNDKRVYL